ncbi:MAG TPA: methyl-accepting chemotaxis protein [Spirochaetota bacterium]|nr:methyl-accepting chemotaxis protein [Spirochaetota bacterium]
MKVAKKVLICCSFFLIIIIIISSNNYLNTKKADVSFNSFYNNRFIGSVYLSKLYSNFIYLKLNMLSQQRAAELKNSKEVERLMDESKTIIQNYKKNLDSYMALPITPDEKKILEDLLAIIKGGADSRTQFSESLLKGNLAESNKYMESWFVFHKNGSVLIDRLVDYQISEGKNLNEQQEKDVASTNILIFVILSISLIIGVVIILLLSKSVSNPVNKGLVFAQKLAEGDFTERIDLEQNDELGILGKALNKTADNLERLISDIIVASQNLVDAVKQIATGNQNLSQRTSEQASALEEVAATIEEATSSINLNYQNSQNASKMSETSSQTAIRGGELVNDTVQSINEVNTSAKKIGEITTVINEIAFQTNLLALNAAVEAARAGDQGRGFAVVAGEVRNLAQRAGNAAKEIAHLINDTVTKVENGTEKTYKSGESLKEIIISVKDVARLVGEIAASSNEQKQGMDQIAAAITGLDNMTQHNAALVEETAGASEEMSNQAQDLIALISRFRIREHSSAAGDAIFNHRVLPSGLIASQAGSAKIYSGTEEKKVMPLNGHEGFEQF